MIFSKHLFKSMIAVIQAVIFPQLTLRVRNTFWATIYIGARFTLLLSRVSQGADTCLQSEGGGKIGKREVKGRYSGEGGGGDFFGVKRRVIRTKKVNLSRGKRQICRHI